MPKLFTQITKVKLNSKDNRNNILKCDFFWLTWHMSKHFLYIFFTLFFTRAFSQDNPPVNIVYNNCRILSVSQIEETIVGIKVIANIQKIEASQYIQTVCNYGNPSGNRYDSVKVIATISIVKDSNNILKTAIYNEFLEKIDKQEKYCASNNYKASVVPEYYFYNLDTLCFPGIRKLNSSKGNDVIWYIEGYVYKITLLEDNQIGDLNNLLRHNVRVELNGKLLNSDRNIYDIAEIKRLIQAW